LPGKACINYSAYELSRLLPFSSSDKEFEQQVSEGVREAISVARQILVEAVKLTFNN
jgi:hypothetical protein